ncbi:MAG: heme ABC transporter permease [Gammaproteobacteria bacterium]|uniref:Heme exporter protein C n=1 Tax=Marinobacter nitratireducens TaxID=1137280 RepID=A0A072N4Q1_9GAMM|nr:Cytochrome c-type biogenesis protein CcmC, putative heme lyase for CcmE [Marinobacter nitratireducens]TNE73577.1 MAG: heme ABC transporter permease [Gammaproteobacteria bacterium]
MWQWFHKLGSPKWFFGIANRLMPWLLAGGLIILAVGVVWGLAFAPKDYLQGNSYRIIFIHVPTAFLAQSVYIMMAVAAVVTLVWRMKLADVFVKAVAPVGLVLTFLALFTGAVWGKPTWGTWWIWDARLTSMLILLFLYGGVIALDRAINDEKSAARAVAVLVLVGVVNIPIIKYSVEWWNTLHQPATLKLTEKPSMSSEMLIPLLLSILGLYLLFGWLACIRMQTEILVREQRTKWVREMVMAGRN